MLLKRFATPLLRNSGSVVAPAGPLLTVREAARALRVSRATVYRLCTRGEMAHVRLLNLIRIPSGAIRSAGSAT
jgi:excisionase family DNA binding protein